MGRFFFVELFHQFYILMDNLQDINCKEIFKKAYENRYTWKNDFNGYQGTVSYTHLTLPTIDRV